MTTYVFTTRLWFHRDGPGAWCFATLPADVADEIRATTERRGFGSVRVRAVIGETAWDTSVFPDSATESYLLPVKADVRRRQQVDAGDDVEVAVTPRP